MLLIEVGKNLVALRGNVHADGLFDSVSFKDFGLEVILNVCNFDLDPPPLLQLPVVVKLFLELRRHVGRQIKR